MGAGMVLHCPQCEQRTLTQATTCPLCNEVFVISMPGLTNTNMPYKAPLVNSRLQTGPMPPFKSSS